MAAIHVHVHQSESGAAMCFPVRGSIVRGECVRGLGGFMLPVCIDSAVDAITNPRPISNLRATARNT